MSLIWLDMDNPFIIRLQNTASKPRPDFVRKKILRRDASVRRLLPLPAKRPHLYKKGRKMLSVIGFPCKRQIKQFVQNQKIPNIKNLRFSFSKNDAAKKPSQHSVTHRISGILIRFRAAAFQQNPHRAIICRMGFGIGQHIGMQHQPAAHQVFQLRLIT